MDNMKQTDTFHMLSDQTRLRALALMAREGEMCVCEFVYALELSQPKISRHMLALRDAGIVVSSRHAQWVFYSINPDLHAWQQQALSAAMEAIKNEKLVIQDKKRLNQMKDRPLKVA